MSIHLQREVERLKKLILSLSATVEKSLRQAVKSIADRDTTLAKQVIENDLEIDQTEIDVEEECLKDPGAPSTRGHRFAFHRGGAEDEQ